jgi:hypothetical protein
LASGGIRVSKRVLHVLTDGYRTITASTAHAQKLAGATDQFTPSRCRGLREMRGTAHVAFHNPTCNRNAFIANVDVRPSDQLRDFILCFSTK